MNVFLTQYDGAILGPIAKVLGYILEGIYSFFDIYHKNTLIFSFFLRFKYIDIRGTFVVIFT